MGLSSLLPAPLRNIVLGLSRIHAYRLSFQGQQDSSGLISRCETLPNDPMSLSPASTIISAAIRIAIASPLAFSFYKYGFVWSATAGFTAFVSLPALSISYGCGMLYQGVAALVNAYAACSFMSLGLGVAYLVGGWTCLEYYDKYQIGVGEYFFIKRFSKTQAQRLFVLID